jgi:two-component system, chemotaxis family, response regulator Rcp1
MGEIHVLLAKENRGDVLLVRPALLPTIFATTSMSPAMAEAVDFVARVGKPGEAPCPDILLLDLNLPLVDGLEMLREFRRHPNYATNAGYCRVFLG